MKTLYRITLTLAVIALLASPLLVSQAKAQSIYDGMRDAEVVSGSLGADDTDVALIIRYIGATAGGGKSGTVTCTGTGCTSLTFKNGAYGSEVADTTFECPVSGALGGIVDLTDSACNTLGKVVDSINSSAYWRAVIVDGLRSDSSNAVFLAKTETKANAVGGISINWDTDLSFDSTIALTTNRSMTDYLSGSNGTTLNPNPFVGQRAVFLIGNATSTYGSGTSKYQVFSCLEAYATTGGSETCTTLYTTPAGASTTNAVFNFLPYGITAKKGEKLIVRLLNSAAMASSVHYAYGRSWFYRQPGAQN